MVLEGRKRGGRFGLGPVHRWKHLLDRTWEVDRQAFHHHGLIGARLQSEPLKRTTETALV